MLAMKWLESLLGGGRSGLLHVYTDGAIRQKAGSTGLAVVVEDDQGNILGWLARRTGPLTCNEAEYEAVLFALENLSTWQPHAAIFFSDSKVVVDQARGYAVARAPGMKQRLARLRLLQTDLPPISFRHIPRRRNRLADALANDVVDGYVSERKNHV